MSELDQGPTEPVIPTGGDAAEAGFLHIGREEDAQSPAAALPLSDVKPTTPLSPQAQERAGTVEHLAARRPMSELDTNTAEIKQRLNELRIEVTRQVTALRWEGQTAADTADHLIPLLNVGPVQQWKDVFIPFLYEIDRGGALLPVWLNIIKRGDPPGLPHDANPAETKEGRARRFAILMLGNYRMMGISGQNTITRPARSEGIRDDMNITQILGYLATDPNTSLYATQALVKHATVPAIQELVTALKDARGWAKVDIVEGCLALNLEQFYDVLVASGLDAVPGLESYVAIPLYRKVPLENYLRGDNETNPRLAQQAALIFNQVLLDAMTMPAAGATDLPALFTRHLPTLADALFAGARRDPTWQNAIAVHRLGTVLGRYWNGISNETIKDGRIIEPVYHCLPMMNDVERWMAGPGRDVLLDTLSGTDDTGLAPTVKALGELREPRATASLIARIEATNELKDRSHALIIGNMCETLGQLGDRRAASPLLNLLRRVVNVPERAARPKRRDNLPPGDPDIPGSIVYAAVMRASGQLGDRSALESVLSATRDIDPYVRTQAIEALKRLDPNGEDDRSRQAVREALDDPRESVMRAASGLVIQYRDSDAVPLLHQLVETRPEYAQTMYDTLHQLGR